MLFTKEVEATTRRRALWRWLPAVIAFLVYCLAMGISSSLRLYDDYTGHRPGIVQESFLVISLAAVSVAIVLGFLAIRKANLGRHGLAYLVTGVVLAVVVFGLILLVGRSH